MSVPPGMAAAAARWAGERPDAPAVLEGDRTWTWRALARWAGAIAEVAARPAGGLVMVEPPMTAAGVAMLHGVAMAGVRAVLLPPRWSPEDQARLVARVRPAVLLVARRDAEPAGVPSLDVRGLAGGPVMMGSGSGAELIVATSGTTAEPRLARLPLSAVDASVAAWRAVLPPATGWLLSLGLAHVAGIGIVARAAAEGIPVSVAPPTEDLAVSLTRPGVSHASVVATQLLRLLDATRDAPPPAGLRCLLLGGGPIPPALLIRALDAGWPAWPSFGQTETASGVVAADPERARAHPGQAGRALPGVELRIRDTGPAASTPDAADATGELEVRGPMTFAGYLDDTAATATRVTPDGWLRTGDLAVLAADGGVRIIDRLDDVVIVGGENVAPAVVEAALAELPGVREAAVVGVPDPEWGQVPVAVVVPRSGGDPDDAALLAGAAGRLPGIARPRRILRCAALPRGGAEKLLRRALRGPAAAASAIPMPDPGDRGPAMESRIVLADDGQPLLVRVAPRVPGDDRPALLLLHATLSSGAQLLRLAADLAPHARVIALDRRGSGGSRMTRAAPVDVARHVEDAAQVLAACGEAEAIVVGHSFGGVVGLELAARRPELVHALAAWEPPYLPLAPEPERGQLIRVAASVQRAHTSRGPAEAARVFMEVVSPGAWDRLRPAQREALEAEGDGVLADAAMPGLDPDGLGAIHIPVRLGTGEASEPIYAPIAAALATRIPGATVASLPGLRHFAPIVTPGPVADLVRALLSRSSDPHPPTQEPTP